MSFINYLQQIDSDTNDSYYSSSWTGYQFAKPQISTHAIRYIYTYLRKRKSNNDQNRGWRTYNDMIRSTDTYLF